MAKFQIADRVSTFCEKVPFSEFLKMPVPKPHVPAEIANLFPLWMVFYREKPGKKRTLKGKWLGGRKHEKLKFKKAGTSEQNNYSIYVHYAAAASELGTIQRISKHKGHGKLVAAFQPTKLEAEKYTHSEGQWRMVHKKYKNFDEMYLMNKQQHRTEFKELTERLSIQYKCNATGQTRMF